LVSAAFEVVSIHQSELARVVGYGPFSLYVFQKEGLCPSCGDINRLMMWQITTYTHKDENNRWTVKAFDREEVPGAVVVRSGDLVRLTHAATARNLHAHRHRAPLTHKYMQVTGYGEVNHSRPYSLYRTDLFYTFMFMALLSFPSLRQSVSFFSYLILYFFLYRFCLSYNCLSFYKCLFFSSCPRHSGPSILCLNHRISILAYAVEKQ
jgi:hypothetical protein